jgi:Icc-related predicted phosphoesterase
MNVQQQLDQEGVDVRRCEYDDTVELVAEFGHVHEASVDAVDETVIVVADGEQYDIDLETTQRASMNNGVLTIEAQR